MTAIFSHANRYTSEDVYLVAGKSALIKFEGGYRPRYQMEHRLEVSQDGVPTSVRKYPIARRCRGGHFQFLVLEISICLRTKQSRAFLMPS